MLLRFAPLFFVLFALPALAQNRSPIDPGVDPVTRTFAITDARVVVAPGRVLDGATVIVRDGLIEAVGADVEVPFDAERIEGDSLTVYAGFIDGLGHAGISEPDDDEDDEVRDPGNPPRDRAGITPEREARDLVDASAGTIASLREVGFTAAHVVPREGLLAGQGALILLAGDDRDGVLLRSGTSLFAQFDGAGGVYPNTPMGVLAVLRQVVRDARRLQIADATYTDDPTGLRRPATNPALEALDGAVSGRQAVFFAVDDALEAHRALRISDELDLDLVLGALPESSHLIDKLSGAEVPVFASLDLPEVPDSTAADSAAVLARVDAEGEVFITQRRTQSYEDVDDETAILQRRRRDAVARYERNAAVLQEAGIPFGFSTRGAKPDEIRANLRRMVAAGLSEDDALAALTTTPAALLDLDRSLGTVEVGKLANLVVVAGSYFDEDAPVRLVVVNGERFEMDEEEDAFDADADITVVGTWDLRVVTPDGPAEGTLTITDDGGLGGTIEVEGQPGSLELENVEVTGNRLSFRVSDTPFGTVDISGIVAGDTYTAEVSGPGAPPLSLTATRQPD